MHKGFSIGFYVNDISFVWNYFLLFEGVGEKYPKFGRKFTSEDSHGTHKRKTINGAKIEIGNLQTSA